jgi:hypothetical protein
MDNLAVNFSIPKHSPLPRVVYGFGGESMTVSVLALIALWFRGKELAFAMGKVIEYYSENNTIILQHATIKTEFNKFT